MAPPAGKLHFSSGGASGGLNCPRWFTSPLPASARLRSIPLLPAACPRCFSARPGACASCAFAATRPGAVPATSRSPPPRWREPRFSRNRAADSTPATSRRSSPSRRAKPRTSAPPSSPCTARASHRARPSPFGRTCRVRPAAVVSCWDANCARAASSPARAADSVSFPTLSMTLRSPPGSTSWNATRTPAFCLVRWPPPGATPRSSGTTSICVSARRTAAGSK